jgi:hypothetical protein
MYDTVPTVLRVDGTTIKNEDYFNCSGGDQSIVRTGLRKRHAGTQPHQSRGTYNKKFLNSAR